MMHHVTKDEVDVFNSINAIARHLATIDNYEYPELFDFRRGIYVEVYQESCQFNKVNINEERWYKQAKEVKALLTLNYDGFDFIDSIPLQTKDIYFDFDSRLDAHQECIKYRGKFTPYSLRCFKDNMSFCFNELKLLSFLKVEGIESIEQKFNSEIDFYYSQGLHHPPFTNKKFAKNEKDVIVRE